MSNKLTDKVVIITGASSGIGAATAMALAKEGAKLVLGARRMDKLAAICQQCQGAGAEAVALSCDVAKREQVQQLVNEAVTRFGRVDVMMANAGYGFVAKVKDVTDTQFDEVCNVNVKGTLYAMQAAAEVMIKQKNGHIIVISSAAARRGLPLYGVYAATKAAQLSIVEAMRVELWKTGVYVSSVHPVTTATEFFDVASKRSNIQTHGLGTSQTAEYVAKKIVRLMERPKPELWPHRLSRIGLSMATLFPRMTDYNMAKIFIRK